MDEDFERELALELIDLRIEQGEWEVMFEPPDYP